MKTTTRLTISAALLGFCAATPVALADENVTPGDDHYGYIFTDDVLKADNPGAVGGLIHVVKLSRRDRLLRPRLHFVPEMLKSVETM